MVSQLTAILGGAIGTAPAPVVRVETKPARERLTEEAIEEGLAQIVALLEKHPNGLRSEEIRTELGMNKKLFQYAAHLGKTSDQLTQSGERRTTTYSLPPRTPKPAPATRGSEAPARVIKRKKK